MRIQAVTDLTPHKDALRQLVNMRAIEESFAVVPATRLYEYTYKRLLAGSSHEALTSEALAKGIDPSELSARIIARSDEALQRLRAIEDERKKRHESIDSCGTLGQLADLRTQWGL